MITLNLIFLLGSTLTSCTDPLHFITAQPQGFTHADDTWPPVSRFTGPFNTHLHSRGSDDVEGSDHTGDKVHDFGEAVLADAPGAVDEEHQVSFGTFAN